MAQKVIPCLSTDRAFPELSGVWPGRGGTCEGMQGLVKERVSVFQITAQSLREDTVLEHLLLGW